MTDRSSDGDGARRRLALVLLAAALGMACDREPASTETTVTASARSPEAAVSASKTGPSTETTVTASVRSTGTGTASVAPDAGRQRDSLTVIAAGDVYFGRTVGQMLLRNPELDLFASVKSLLDSADVRFGNLESQLSDQRGETGHPEARRVFTGPPSGADALARAGFTIVSTANNHMWDYGKTALLETMANLERVGVLYVGSGRTRAVAYGPVLVERDGFRVAFLAVTDIWNQGPLRSHPARDFVAMADPELLAEAIRPVRADPRTDAIVVSYHGGSEYMQEPTQPTRAVVHAAVDAGADIVIGHHPHCVQGIGWYRGKPILYSLGNFTMGMHPDHAWSEMGYLARISLRRGQTPTVEVCPYRLHGNQPIALEGDARRGYFFRRLAALSKQVAGSEIGPVGSDGCASVSPPAVPFPGAVP